MLDRSKKLPHFRISANLLMNLLVPGIHPFSFSMLHNRVTRWVGTYV